MDIPRGHAAMPLTEADFLDFIYNYFKAEYAPIRSFWSTATADPRQPSRWYSMGHEMSPRTVRPANAQAQKDLESLDYFTKKWNLDASFIRGLVIRFAKYELHDRLEKKLFECARLDLMVRKALKEKHLIDALWPSPAPRNLPHELLAQGVQVRRWYGDMFNKYFRVLHSIEEFELRPEVDLRIKNSGTFMLFPFVDHLVLGAVDPILPIVAQGAGYSNAKGWRASGSSRSDGFGEPGHFEIRFDAPADVQETYTQTVTRQCQCNKCGTKRDVEVVISIDPNTTSNTTAGPASSSKPSTSNSSDQRRPISKTAQRYAPGYNMPTAQTHPPTQPPRPQPQPANPPRPSTPDPKKQCPRCTFLNHADLSACEMCQASLPAATVQKPPSPRVSHAHSASNPPPSRRANKSLEIPRPAGPNRHSLSSTLFSIFPFAQGEQQEHHAQLPATQQTDTTSVQRKPTHAREDKTAPSAPLNAKDAGLHHRPRPAHANPEEQRQEKTLSRAPEMSLMALSPSETAVKRPAPAGLPSNLMDDFVPVSPAYVPEVDGWGEMRREEAREGSEDEDEGSGSGKGGLVDLDAVAR